MAEPYESVPGGEQYAPPPPYDPGAATGAGSTGSAASPGGPASAANAAVQEVIDASADFLIAGRDYVRQEAEGVMREKIAPPLAEVGITVASWWAAILFLVLGLVFIGVAAMIALSQLVGPALAFLIVGAIYMIGAGIFLYVKVRQVQASAVALEANRALRGVADPAAGPGAVPAATPSVPKKSRKAQS